MNAFARSWALFKSTLAVLNADKELLWFPILATTVTFVISAIVFGLVAVVLMTNPAAQAFVAQAAQAAEAGNADLLQMIFFFASLFVYYLIIYFVQNSGGSSGEQKVSKITHPCAHSASWRRLSRGRWRTFWWLHHGCST